MKVEIYDPTKEAEAPETIVTLHLETTDSGKRVRLIAVSPETGERLPYGTIMSFSTGADKLTFRPSVGCYIGGVDNQIVEEGSS